MSANPTGKTAEKRKNRDHLWLLPSTFALLMPIGESIANTPPFVAPLNDQRIAAGEQLRVQVVPSDADGDVPGLRIIDFPSGAMFSDNGDGTRTFAWMPTDEDVGEYAFTFEAFDARDVNLTGSQTMRVTVVSADDNPDDNPDGNLPPDIESLNDQSVQLGERFDFRVVAIDPEGFVPSLNVQPLPQGASFDDNGDGTRQFVWQPTLSSPGSIELAFTATDALDNTLTSTRRVVLRTLDDDGEQLPGELVAGDPRNRAPLLGSLTDQQVMLGEEFDFIVRPFDLDGDVPGLAVDRLPPNATFSDNLDGSRTFRWRPFPINMGDTFVTFQAIDAKDPALRTLQTVRLRVIKDPDSPVNFPPRINGIRNPVIRVGDTLNQQVQPVDPDFTVPSLIVLNPPAGASFPDTGNGIRTLRWPVDENDIGDTSISFLAIDSEDPEAQASSTISVRVVEPESLQRPGTRLRDLADARGFKIGFAAVLNSAAIADNELYREIAAEEFNIVTPENSHKMGWIHPQRGEFRFEDADDLADYAQANAMQLHGHPLIWYAQLPGWVQRLDPAEAEDVMVEHIDAVAGRYKGRVAIWDVVNEALEDDGRLRQSIWFKGMGEDYIGKAFRAARAVDPDAVLIYNDYDVVWENQKSDAMYELVKRELAAGTPIDGVGFQMHLRSGFDLFDSVVSNLQRFAELGLDIYITEFDVALDAPDTLQTQAAVYQHSLEICLAQPRCKAMQAWGYTDRYSWRSSSTPLLLTDYYAVKPSYLAWQETLRDFQP